MRPTTCKLCGFQFHIKEKAKQEWVENNYTCPNCNETYVMLPETERQLRILQDEFYISGRDEKVMTKMIVLMMSYTKSLILKLFSNKITYEGQLEYYAHSAVTYLIEEYYKDETFKITISYAGFIINKIKQAIFGKQEYASADESLDFIFEDGHNIIYKDEGKQLIDSIEEDENKFLLCKQLCNIIFDIEKYCDSKFENYVRLFNIYSYLNNGEASTDKFFNIYGREGKLITLQTLDLLKKELKKIDSSYIVY